MKRFLFLILSMICVVSLLGCTKGVESCPNAKTMPRAEAAKKEETSTEIISSDMLGQGVYDALRADWDAWNAKDDLQKALSSHMPGHCYMQFEDWTECEAFVGFELFNPLEESEFEKGTFVGMPEGFNEAPRFYVSFYGTTEGQVEWIHVESGYRDGDIRITVDARISVDTPKENMDGAEPLITEDSGERYVATTAVLVRGPITYHVRVIGETNKWEEVRATLDKVLPCFTENTNG